MTDTAPHVFKAISQVTSKLKQTGIGKDNRNKEQGYNFRGIDQVYQALCTALTEAQLIVTPRVVEQRLTERLSAKGNKMFNVSLTVEYDFVSAVDGSKHVTRSIGESTDSGDKATNKALSAAYKYMAIQAFCIPVEGEPDADANTNEDTAADEPAIQPARNRRQRAQAPEQPQESAADEPAQEPDNSDQDSGSKISVLQQAEVTLLLERSKADVPRFLQHYGVKDVSGLLEADFKAITSQLNEKILRMTRGNAKTNEFKGVRPS